MFLNIQYYNIKLYNRVIIWHLSTGPILNECPAPNEISFSTYNGLLDALQNKVTLIHFFQILQLVHKELAAETHLLYRKLPPCFSADHVKATLYR